MKRFLIVFNIACSVGTIALLVWLIRSPRTGWLVQAQLASNVGFPVPIGMRLHQAGIKEVSEMPPMGNVIAEKIKLEAVAARHPEDFQIQLAHAIDLWSVQDSSAPGLWRPAVEYVRNIKPQFTSNPAYYAAELRFAGMGEVSRCRRAEEDWLEGNPAPTPSLARPTQQVLTAFNSAATHGEKLDPDNAFFPVERSIALFAANRDAEALAALRKAAKCSRYDDYVQDEIQGRDRLRSEALGREPAVLRIMDRAIVFYPHISGVRSAARVATALAAKREVAGRVDEGLAIRDTVRRIAGRIRSESRTSLGIRVGCAMSELALARPGGAKAVRITEWSDWEPNNAATERFRNYLAKVDRASAWSAFKRELDAANEARSILRPEDMAFEGMVKPIGALARSWQPSLIALANVLWMAVTGAAFIAVWMVVRGREREMRPHDDAMFLLASGFCLLCAMALAARQQRRAMLAFTVFTESLRSISSEHRPQLGLSPGASTAALAAPALAAVVALIFCVIRRLPLVTGVPRAIALLTAPLCLASAITYAVLVNRTLELEDRKGTRLERMIQHEGRYYAELARKQWPP